MPQAMNAKTSHRIGQKNIMVQVCQGSTEVALGTKVRKSSTKASIMITPKSVGKYDIFKIFLIFDGIDK